jgi:hypothetical protein
MNRRSFFKSLATAAAGFAILPSAATYTRAPWKKVASGIWVVNPDYINAEYEISCFVNEASKTFYKDGMADVYIALRNRNLEIEHEVPKDLRFINDPWPVRYHNKEDALLPDKNIPPFKQL